MFREDTKQGEANEKYFPVGEFHKQFKIPQQCSSPVVLTPSQLKFLITNIEFEKSLSTNLQKTKDIVVFGCTVGLRYQDLMRLTKHNLIRSDDEMFIVLHTQKTNQSVSIPLPAYAMQICNKYKKVAGKYVLPRVSNAYLNIQIKLLAQQAGWIEPLPKIVFRMGEPVEIKNKKNEIYKFYEHLTVHTMRRTAITTLLLLGVEEQNVRRISGHASGSKEFYKYVIIVQDYLNRKVKKAFDKLISDDQIEY